MEAWSGLVARNFVVLTGNPLAAVILAACQGTRMRSRTPKVMHPLGGRPMIDHVVEACRQAGVERPVAVLNPGQPEVIEHVGGACRVVLQAQPQGTGHAVA